MEQQLIEQRLFAPKVFPNTILTRHGHPTDSRFQVTKAILELRHLANVLHPLGRRVGILSGRGRNEAAMVRRSQRANRRGRFGETLGRLLAHQQVVGARPVLGLV